MSICIKSEVVSSQNIVIPPIDTLRVKFSSLGSNNKRNLSVVGDCQKEKRRKMDHTVTQQCAFILKQLKNHPAGWVFNQPVDPVKLQIPDYHDVISHPMDLGTVKKKLDKNEYSSVDEFVAHVRLTFSNAMTYNPPANSVHVMAKDLNIFFNSEWSALEAKWSGDRKNVHQKQIISRIVKSTNISGKNGTKKPPPHAMLEPKSLISALEKQKLREQLLELIRGNVPSHLEGFLRKIGFDLQRVEKIEEIVDALGEEDLWELQKITSSSWVVQAAKIAAVARAGELERSLLMSEQARETSEQSRQALEGRVAELEASSIASEEARKRAEAERDETLSACPSLYNTFFVQGWSDSAQFLRAPATHPVWGSGNLLLPFPDAPAPELVPLSPREESDVE